MANAQRGEVELVVGDKTYKLRLGINAIVEVEDVLGGVGINEIIASLDPANVRIGTLRAILWGALREHHPEVTLLDAGDLIGEVGAAAIAPVVGEAIGAAFPRSEGAKRPRKAAKAGTGKSS